MVFRLKAGVVLIAVVLAVPVCPPPVVLRGSDSGENTVPIWYADRSTPNVFARPRLTSRIWTSMTTSARGLSFASIIFSMIAATAVVARIVIVLLVLFGAIIGCTAIAGTRMIVLIIWDSSVASAWETKKVRIT